MPTRVIPAIIIEGTDTGAAAGMLATGHLALARIREVRAVNKFQIDQRVIFALNGERHRGRITGVEPKVRRVVTDSGKRFVVPVRKLKMSPDRALILETRLDRSLRSSRIYGPMMQQWLWAFGIEALYERVHTIEDIRRFLKQEGRNVATRYVHVMGHGTDQRGAGRATLHLTFEPLPLGDNAEIFEGLDGKVLLFSCCEIGANRRVLERIKRASGASAVIAYRVAVNDWYTNIAEALLYERLVNSSMTPQHAVRLVGEALQCLGTRVDTVVTRAPVLVCV